MCTPCPPHGSLAGLVIGTGGNGVAAVAWGTCGEPSFGHAGVQLFGIDPAGTVTVGPDLTGALTDQGMPSAFCGLGLAGASHYVAKFVSNGVLYAASDTLPVDTQTATFVGAQFPGYPAPPTCGVAAIDGDAAGETFASVAAMSLPTGPVYIEKLDNTGTPLWTVPPQPSFSPGPFEPTLVADGAGGVYLGASNIGTSALDLGCGPVTGSFVMRFDGAGQCLWSRSSPALGPYFAGRILPADAGQVVVTSPFRGTVDLGCGPMTSSSGTSSLVAKLDACGACVWSRSFATPSLDVQSFPGGELLVSTTYSGTIDLGGGPLTSAGASSVAVGRLSGSGATLWSRSLGAAGATVTESRATADAMGGAALVLSVTGAADFGGGPVGSGGVLLKLDASGALRWQRAPFSGLIASDPCGAVIAASDCTSCAPGNGWGVSVVKLAP